MPGACFVEPREWTMGDKRREVHLCTIGRVDSEISIGGQQAHRERSEGSLQSVDHPLHKVLDEEEVHTRLA